MKLVSLFLLHLVPFSLVFSHVIHKDENPGSAWCDERVSPFLDRIARNKGDLITILIDESSTADFEANTNLSKKDSNFLQQMINAATHITSPSLRFLKAVNKAFPMNNSVDSKNEGKGKTGQKSAIQAKLTGKVVEILPGGRLAIEANKDIKVNRETQTFVLCGIIRNQDITPENTVLSSLISDADIHFKGKGAAHDRQRRGFITRALDWVF